MGASILRRHWLSLSSMRDLEFSRVCCRPAATYSSLEASEVRTVDTVSAEKSSSSTCRPRSLAPSSRTLVRRAWP